MNYEEIFKKAKAYGEKRGLGPDAEDFAQECAIKAFKISGPISFEYCFLNYRDYQLANKRILGSIASKLSSFNKISLDAPINDSEQNSAKFGDIIGVSGNDVDHRGFAHRCKEIVESIGGRDAEIFCLHCDGYTLDEIGLQFGVSKSRISQRLKRLREFATVVSVLNKSHWGFVINAFNHRKPSVRFNRTRVIEQRDCGTDENYRENRKVSRKQYLRKNERNKSRAIDRKNAIN